MMRNADIRPRNREEILAALQQCEEKEEYYKMKLESNEKEKKLLQVELRNDDLGRVHNRLAEINGALHNCLVERRQLQVQDQERIQELEAEIQRLVLDRKHALFVGMQDGPNSYQSLVKLDGYFWQLHLSDEERHQRGYVMAALNGSVFRYDEDDSFSETYPELSGDRAVFMARIKNRSHPCIQKDPLVIPEPYRDDQEVILALIEHCTYPSIGHVSQRLMSSRDFFLQR